MRVERTSLVYETSSLPLRYEGGGGHGPNRTDSIPALQAVLFPLEYVAMVDATGVEPAAT